MSAHCSLEHGAQKVGAEDCAEPGPVHKMPIQRETTEQKSQDIEVEHHWLPVADLAAGGC
jgi:hypothetical protein